MTVHCKIHSKLILSTRPVVIKTKGHVFLLLTVIRMQLGCYRTAQLYCFHVYELMRTIWITTVLYLPKKGLSKWQSLSLGIIYMKKY